MVSCDTKHHDGILTRLCARVYGREISRDLIAALPDKALIAHGPRAPRPGAPFAYVTTGRFLETFGLETLGDLPDLEALRDARLEVEA